MNAHPLVDQVARDRIRTALDDTLVVEAAAGTGKTTELVLRIVRVLATGAAAVQEIVAVTFTEKAAGELRLRLREQIEVARTSATDPVEASRLDDAVQALEDARISTIHGFCADLLRERPVEAGVDPLFRVLTEGQADRLFDQAFDAWFASVVEDPPEGVRRSLRRTVRGWGAGGGAGAGGASDDGPVARLRQAARALREWRDFPAPWRRIDLDRDAAVDAIVEAVHAFARLTAQPSRTSDNLYADTAPVRRLSAALTRQAESGPADRDGAEALVVELARDRTFRQRARKGSGASYGPGVTRVQVLDQRTALTDALTAFQMAADADLAARLHDELRDAVAGYEVLKAREGALDFLDLLLKTRDLLVQDRAVREAFQRRFRRIFVDEFQDTDPLQADILLLLAADTADVTEREAVRPVPGKLFVVGDPKQAIYRFRRADVDLYLQIVEQLEHSGAARVELRASFRSVPGIQQVVNRAFHGVLDRPGGAGTRVAPYVPLAPVREACDSQPAVVALPVPKPYAFRGVSGRAIEASLPDAAAAWVDWLVRESGWVVTERGGGPPVPVAARHVCLLFRRFVSFGEDVTRPYVEALEARGIPHLLVGGRAFHGREEIETLRAALAAIEWPDDQLSVFATLRGSLFAIGDEELFEYRHLAGRFHPFRVPDALPAHLAPVADACRVLRELHRQRNRRPVADTVTGVLDAVRAHAGFVLRPGGEQVLANVLHVAELARQYEMDGGMSFRGFVERLHDEATRAQAAEAPVLEEGTDGVRLMTAHKAKGLEFPVVVLADISARLAPTEAGRTVDQFRRLCAQRLGGWLPVELLEAQVAECEQERREGERIAYVAATRARDVLVVPAVGDAPFDGWVAPLNRAIYPDIGVRRDGRPSPGVPAFASRDTVLERPDGDPAGLGTVAPGLHVLTGDGPETGVVWWSPEPGALNLDVEPAFGIRRDDLIVRDVAPEVLAAQHLAHARWRDGRSAAITAASQPSLTVVTATEAAADPAVTFGSDIEVAVERLSAEGGAAGQGPSGLRFGSLVHAVLADADLPAGAQVAGLAEVHGRLLGASEPERQEAVRTVTAVLAHPLLGRAAEAVTRGACWREVPITARTAGARVIEGTADLVFEEHGVVTVVDFKTGEPDAATLERYRRQVQIYAGAVAGATGRPAQGVLLLV